VSKHHAPAPFHFLRAACVATGILALAAGAHAAGGGDLPAPGILLAVLALTALACTAATRLRLSFPAMTVLLGAGQVVLHQVFTASSAAGLAVDPAVPDLHHVSSAASPVIGTASGHLHQPDSPAGTLMLLAHALATVTCALLMAKGEAALWALAGWLRPLVRLPEAVRPDAGPRPAVPGPPPVPPFRRWRNLRQHSRRGPPSAVVLS
jgi:hypothetical protein